MACRCKYTAKNFFNKIFYIPKCRAKRGTSTTSGCNPPAHCCKVPKESGLSRPKRWGKAFCGNGWRLVIVADFNHKCLIRRTLPAISQTAVSGCIFYSHCFSCPIFLSVSVSSSGLFVPISNFLLLENSSCNPLFPATLNAVPFPKNPNRKPQPPYSVKGEYCRTNDLVKVFQG